ncbi:hypothetical protein MMC25_005886 [Agyrium rufum]|nr:hypothetical protein [Agyrium rufum]
MNTVEEPLLEKGSDRCELLGPEQHAISKPQSDIVNSRRRNRAYIKSCMVFTILQLILIGIYSLVFLHLRSSLSVKSADGYHPDIPRTPAKDAVKFEEKYFVKLGYLTSPYSGEPRAELDNAWHQLLEGMNIKVSADYLKPYNATSIPLRDGSGYLAQLAIYHDMHCLKKFKHWMYRDHYYPGSSESELSEQKAHVEHCIDWLRVSALCRGDTTLNTFYWGNTNPPTLETQYPIPHQCVNQDSLLGWSRAHSVDITDPDLLLGPDEL